MLLHYLLVIQKKKQTFSIIIYITKSLQILLILDIILQIWFGWKDYIDLDKRFGLLLKKKCKYKIDR